MRKLTDQEKQYVVDLLSHLVKIDSTDASVENANQRRCEERIAHFLTQYLSELGMNVEAREVYPGRPNLLAHWPDQDGAKSLMLEAHMDTVPVEGMTVDPFNIEISDGRIYGRGTCDTKGSMAAMLTALHLARQAGQLPADKLWFVAAMGEETGCTGATALMNSGFRCDAAIVGEPTRCELVTAHKGTLWLAIETHGIACHASVPEKGRNAIALMSRVVEYIHGPWTQHIQKMAHPLLGKSTAQATCIEGGAKVNILPARCRVDVDARFIPGIIIDDAIRDLEQLLADHLGSRELFRITHAEHHGSLDCPPESPLADRLLQLCNQFNRQEKPRGVNYFADSGPFSQAGIRSVLFGPGDIAQAHTADEYLELDQLFQATEILLNLLIENAGKSIVE